MNPTLSLPCVSVPWPDQIVTHWKRFACGLWRLPEGDIAAAYCADTFPKIKVFTHDGCLFTNCGGHFRGPARTEVNGYPLLPPEQYRGPEPAQYTYEGRTAFHQKQPFKLGRKVVFTSSDPTVAEWRRLFRVLYADGGMFAHGVTYLGFLKERLDPVSANEISAHQQELAECAAKPMPETNAEMRDLLESDGESSLPAGGPQQMALGL